MRLQYQITNKLMILRSVPTRVYWDRLNTPNLLGLPGVRYQWCISVTHSFHGMPHLWKCSTPGYMHWCTTVSGLGRQKLALLLPTGVFTKLENPWRVPRCVTNLFKKISDFVKKNKARCDAPLPSCTAMCFSASVFQSSQCSCQRPNSGTGISVP